MSDENVRVEKRICSYHIGEICGMPAIYLTDPPIEGEPTGELIKKLRLMIKSFVRKALIFLNTNKYKFETLEELQQIYPIHSIFSQRAERHIDLRTYYNSNDLKVFKRYSDQVEILDDTTCITYKTLVNVRTVEGYLYDGKYWYPAYNTHDGWVEYDESDIFKEEEITFDNAKYQRKYP